MIKEYRLRITGTKFEHNFAEKLIKDIVDTIRFHIDSITGDVEFYTIEVIERTGLMYGLESIDKLNNKIADKVVNKV